MLEIMVSQAANYASAQLMPLPPPFPNNSAEEAIKVAANDKDPPRIAILTKELHEGKNVFKVRISDNSSLQTREVEYVENGQLKIIGLFREHDDVYDALINIHWPSRIVMVTAGDVNGNTSTAFREYEIKPAPDLLIQIVDVISQALGYIQNFLGGK